MSTITLQITYNQATKKLLVPKSITVAQLTTKALEKHNQTGNGQLYYNDKALDSSLPLRLTNLISNSKLILKAVTSGGGEIRVKFSDINTTVISKVKSNITLLQLIEEIEAQHNLELLSKGASHLVLMNAIYNSSHYPSTRLDTIVGNVSSVVIRMNYEKDDGEKDRRRKEQQDIVTLQLQQQEERLIRLREEKEMNKNQIEIETNEEIQEPKKIPIDHESGVIVKDNLQDNLVSKNIVAKPVKKGLESSQNPAKREAEIVESSNSYSQGVDPIVETPQLFIPGQHAPTYENPDDDYNMTVTQAQTYHKLIQDYGKRKKKLVVPPPSKYLIRIKFPDRSILQINFVHEVDTIKFGQLIKKIDELLLPQYLNNYSLKFGYPPFARLEPSFKLNDTKLTEMPDFQSERIILIWETQSLDKGPFVKQEEMGEIKKSNEMPEVVLESHRSELPDEKVTVQKDRKLPKWFKK